MKRIAIIMAACFCLLPSLSAQKIRKYEIGAGASYGFKVDKIKANNYGFELFGGYKINDHFSAGVGLNYLNFNGRMDLPSGIENDSIWTENYSAYRPFVYGRKTTRLIAPLSMADTTSCQTGNGLPLSAYVWDMRFSIIHPCILQCFLLQDRVMIPSICPNMRI